MLARSEPGPTAVSMDFDAIFFALSDRTRRAILERLRSGAESVTRLAETLPVSRGAVSQHLKILLDAGLVAVEPVGRQRLYRAVGLDAVAAYVAAAQGSPPPQSKVRVADELAKWRSEAPHIEPEALALLMHFAQLGQSILRSNEAVAGEVGLRFSDVAVLGALRRLGPPYESSPTELARTFWISLPGMMKRLAPLEAEGFIARRSNPDDGRGVLIRLTDRGLQVLRELVAHHQPPEYHALLRMPAADRLRLLDLVSTLLAEIGAGGGTARVPDFVVSEAAAEQTGG